MHHPDETAERAELRAGMEQDAQRRLTPDLIEIWKPIQEAMIDAVIAKRRMLRSMGLPIETKAKVTRLPSGFNLALEIPSA